MHEAGRARTTGRALGGWRGASYFRSSKAFVGVRLASAGWRALQLMHRVVRQPGHHPSEASPNMGLDAVPDFVLDVSQDICELVLTGALDLASTDGRTAASIAHRTYVSRNSTRPTLAQGQALETAGGSEAFEEVLAFVFSWTDSVLQASAFRAEWMSVRQRRLGDVLCNLAALCRFSDAKLHHLDELIARRSLEYGPSPFDASIALGVHLGSMFGPDGTLHAACTNAFVVGASVEFFRELERRDADA